MKLSLKSSYSVWWYCWSRGGLSKPSVTRKLLFQAFQVSETRHNLIEWFWIWNSHPCFKGLASLLSFPRQGKAYFHFPLPPPGRFQCLLFCMGPDICGSRQQPALESWPLTLSMRLKPGGSFLSLELWFPVMGLPGRNGEEREARET